MFIKELSREKGKSVEDINPYQRPLVHIKAIVQTSCSQTEVTYWEGPGNDMSMRMCVCVCVCVYGSQ